MESHKPPPNPAKVTDSRFVGYLRRFGTRSWELDALEPAVINGLIREAVAEYIEPEAWSAAIDRQEAGRRQLSAAIERLR